MRNIIQILILVLFNTIVRCQCYKAIATGGESTLAIKTDGSLWAWGRNYEGQLGDSTIINKINPTRIGLDTNWLMVSASLYHSLGIKTNGTLWAWGFNYYGQLGDGTVKSKITPIQIGVDTTWNEIKAGDIHSLALKENGSLWAWGGNFVGQLGDGTTINKTTPTQIGTDTSWQSIGIGNVFSVALKYNGTIWTWGDNDFGQLGDSTFIEKHIPTRVGVDTNWQSIAVGSAHVIALKTNGTIWSWGQNFDGQLGDNSIIHKNIAQQIGNDSDWYSIAKGAFHSFGIKNNGTKWSWGLNFDGQLGDGTTTDQSNPVPLINVYNNVTIVDAGWSFTNIIESDGTFWSWGRNDRGQLGNNTSINSSTPIVSSYCSPLGIKANNNNLFFGVFPNPANETIKLLNFNNHSIEKIVIIKVLGKIILEKKGVDCPINIKELPQEVYILEATSNGKTYRCKFIKE